MKREENKFNFENHKLTDLDYYDKLSDEEKLKELNLLNEQIHQESIAKYGRDIYSENKQVGDPKAVKRRNFWDKIFDLYYNIRVYLLLAILIFILVKVWSGALLGLKASFSQIK